MGNCWAKFACDYAKDQIGNECGKTNKYSEEMDDINFYNLPKNGEADSCSIFVDNCVLHACTDPTYEEDPDGAKWTALYMLNEPQSAGANEGAGCAQSVGYFQQMGEWYTDTQDYERGDKYFLRRNSSVSNRNPLGVYHTGIIVDWNEEGFTCVEGNTNGGMVAEKFYSYSDAQKRWAGVGRPRYDGWEPDVSGSEDQEPETPEDQETEPSEKKYTVHVNTRLRVRNGCGTAYPIVDFLNNGEVVTVYEERNGWGRISNNMDLWVCMDYLQ